MYNSTNLAKISRTIFNSEREMESEMARYDHECGPVKVYKMSEAVMEQTPVAYLEDLDVRPQS